MPVLQIPQPDRERAILELAGALQAHEEVAFAFVHGSFLLDGPFRDIDVAVFLGPSTPHPAERALELGEQLSALVRMPVDVRALNDAPVTFRFHALRGRLLCANDEALLGDTLEATMRHYFDLEPILRQATREAFAR
jgi:uncharacterized protein